MTTATLAAAAITFCGWAVYLGGLAAMQHDCNSVDLTNGLMSANNCSKSYRLQWFYMSWEAAILVITFVAVATARLAHVRMALVGLFAVATVLFIDVSNTMLVGYDTVSYWQSGSPQNKIRAIIAGSIITATMNAFAILAIGSTCLYPELDRPVAEKPLPPA